MDATLQTHDIVIRANEKFAKLDIVADSLAVFETNSPFDLTDEKSFLFQGIDRACRLNVKKPGFQFRKMKVMRPEGVTGDIVIKFAVGDGVEFIDGRLQYKSITDYKAAFTVTAIPPAVRSRFVPRLNAQATLASQKVYTPDLANGPRITANTNFILNPLALKNPQVTKRVIRLITGAAAQIGFGEQAVDPAVPGNSRTITTADPEVTIEGGETLLGYATTGDGDATLSVREVLQDSGAGIDPVPAKYAPTLTTQQIALFPPASLNASVSYSFAVGSVIAGSGYEANLFGGISLCPSWGSCASGTLKTNGKALVGVINTINIANLPAAEVFANRSFYPWWGPNGQLPDDGNAYVSFTLVATNTTSRINTSTGQSFLLPKNVTGQFPPGLFRIAFPYDGSAPYFEQGSATDPSGWVRNS